MHEDFHPPVCEPIRENPTKWLQYEQGDHSHRQGRAMVVIGGLVFKSVR